MLLGFRHCCLRTKAIRAATCSQGASFLREEDVQRSKPLNRHKTIQNDHACWRIQQRRSRAPGSSSMGWCSGWCLLSWDVSDRKAVTQREGPEASWHILSKSKSLWRYYFSTLQIWWSELITQTEGKCRSVTNQTKHNHQPSIVDEPAPQVNEPDKAAASQKANINQIRETHNASAPTEAFMSCHLTPKFATVSEKL